jgi:hypothetical protein
MRGYLVAVLSCVFFAGCITVSPPPSMTQEVMAMFGWGKVPSVLNCIFYPFGAIRDYPPRAIC